VNGFDAARQVEYRAMKELDLFLSFHSYNGRCVRLEKGPLAPALQKMVGDVLLTGKRDRRLWGLEIKAEAEKRTPNLFLESWSNRGHHTPGWLITLQTDLLLYYFLDTKEAFLVNFHHLWQWAFVDTGQNGYAGRLWDFPEKPQAKYLQRNDTFGRCVPIAVLMAEVGMRRMRVHPQQLCLEFEGETFILEAVGVGV
jgi:hypothetical protein